MGYGDHPSISHAMCHGGNKVTLFQIYGGSIPSTKAGPDKFWGSGARCIFVLHWPPFLLKPGLEGS